MNIEESDLIAVLIARGDKLAHVQLSDSTGSNPAKATSTSAKSLRHLLEWIITVTPDWKADCQATRTQSCRPYHA
jgi:sugar phosphate isomerase/epimerase